MNILYISFDGLTDPLGQSQVLPYLKELARKNYQITIISCEKQMNYSLNHSLIEEVVTKSGITWIPVAYYGRIPFFSAWLNTLRMRRQAFRTASSKSFSIVHCRSYLSALIGLALKKKLGMKFIFDMRGLWADERLDGGLWNLSNPMHRWAYTYFKKKERVFLSQADQIVSLTQSGAAEIGKIMSGQSYAPITVIPCCADLDLFDYNRIDKTRQRELRAELGLNDNDFVISYLGSLGTWYMIPEMLSFFKQLQVHCPDARFLILTPDKPELIYAQSLKLQIPESSLIIRYAKRAEVPLYLSLSRLSVFFIKPCYSKKASSPTKLAELLGMGIPVIGNYGIGDMEEQISSTHSGLILQSFTKEEYEKKLNQLPQLLQMEKVSFRQAALDNFSLSLGVERYSDIYYQLL